MEFVATSLANRQLSHLFTPVTSSRKHPDCSRKASAKGKLAGCFVPWSWELIRFQRRRVSGLGLTLQGSLHLIKTSPFKWFDSILNQRTIHSLLRRRNQFIIEPRLARACCLPLGPQVRLGGIQVKQKLIKRGMALWMSQHSGLYSGLDWPWRK